MAYTELLACFLMSSRNLRIGSVRTEYPIIFAVLCCYIFGVGGLEKSPLCCHGYPGTYLADQDGLELRAQGSASLSIPSVKIKDVYHHTRLDTFLF